MDNKCVEKLLETVAFSNGCICSVELIRWEHTHFHPSGKLNPSKWDTMITDRMLKVGELIGIPLRDHIIVGGDNHSYFSFREKGLMEFEHVKLEEDYLKIDKERFAVAEAGAEEMAAPVRRKRSR